MYYFSLSLFHFSLHSFLVWVLFCSLSLGWDALYVSQLSLSSSFSHLPSQPSLTFILIDVIIFRWIVFLVFSSSFSGYFLGIFCGFGQWRLASGLGQVKIGEWVCDWCRRGSEGAAAAWVSCGDGFVTDVGVDQVVQRWRGFWRWWVSGFGFGFCYEFWLDFAMNFAQQRWVVWLRNWTVVVGGWESRRNRDKRKKWEIFLYYFNE